MGNAAKVKINNHYDLTSVIRTWLFVGVFCVPGAFGVVLVSVGDSNTFGWPDLAVFSVLFIPWLTWLLSRLGLRALAAVEVDDTGTLRITRWCGWRTTIAPRKVVRSAGLTIYGESGLPARFSSLYWDIDQILDLLRGIGHTQIDPPTNPDRAERIIRALVLAFLLVVFLLVLFVLTRLVATFF